MDPDTLSTDRLLLSCESIQHLFGPSRLRRRNGKIPSAATNEAGRENCSLPPGFPKSIVSPTAWTGADIENDPSQERYSLIFNEADIEELEKACEYFKGMFARDFFLSRPEVLVHEFDSHLMSSDMGGF